MWNKSVSLGIIAALIVGGIGVWYLIASSSPHQGKTKSARSTNVSYFCPMHPQIKSDKPGSCPICGMDLVLANEHDQSETEHNSMLGNDGHTNVSPTNDGKTSSNEKTNNFPSSPDGRSSLQLTFAKQQSIGVKYTEVRRKNLFKSIRAPGRIAFDPELYTAQSEYLEALRQWKRVQNSSIADVRENTRQMIRSSKIRLQVLGLTEQQIGDLAQKGAQSEGLLVSGQDNLIYADIFEVDLPYIKEGQSAKITANFLQGKTLPGVVSSVDRVINPETRTAKVRIKLVKSDAAIRPESYVNVTIFAPVGEHLAVPLEALLDTGRDTFVFIRKSASDLVPISVRVLLETNTDAAILGNIHEGDPVVVDANFLIDSESRLQSVIRGTKSAKDESGEGTAL